MGNKAIVVGATGLIGRGLVEHLNQQPDWSVIGLSRGKHAPDLGIEMIAADLLDKDATRRGLAGCGDVTHLFYAGYAPRPSRAEEVQPNRAMLINVVEALEGVSPALERIVLTTGTKYYGVHLSAIRTPAVETDPRHLPPNFYYDQVDALARLQTGKSWTWTHLIPPFVTGLAVGHPMNLVMALSIYASISRHYGLPLRFPGARGTFGRLFHFADSRQIASAAEWAATSPVAGNQTFNVANGDPTRWCNVWPALAQAFDMEWGDVKTMPLGEFMRDKAPVWAQIVKQHGLIDLPFDTYVNWEWADYMFRIDYDIVVALGKLRRAGFADSPDTLELLCGRIRQLKELRIIP